MLGFGDEFHVFHAFQLVIVQSVLKIGEFLTVHHEQLVFVELHFQRNPRVEDRDAGAAVVEQQIFEVVQDALQDRQVDVLAIEVLVPAVAFVAGFQDHVDHRPQRVQQIEEDVEHLDLG